MTGRWSPRINATNYRTALVLLRNTNESFDGPVNSQKEKSKLRCTHLNNLSHGSSSGKRTDVHLCWTFVLEYEGSIDGSNHLRIPWNFLKFLYSLMDRELKMSRWPSIQLELFKRSWSSLLRTILFLKFLESLIHWQKINVVRTKSKGEMLYPHEVISLHMRADFLWGVKNTNSIKAMIFN